MNVILVITCLFKNTIKPYNTTMNPKHNTTITYLLKRFSSSSVIRRLLVNHEKETFSAELQKKIPFYWMTSPPQLPKHLFCKHSYVKHVLKNSLPFLFNYSLFKVFTLVCKACCKELFSFLFFYYSNISFMFSSSELFSQVTLYRYY